MSPYEFVVASRYWLGLPLFPFLPNNIRVCVVSHVSDPYGDLFVGCGHGLHRLNRQRLCETIWQSLLIAKQVVKERRNLGETKYPPGNFLHSSYFTGRPGYFAITVRNTLQPSYIPRVAETSGIVAEAAEMDTDDRHDARVTSVGGFYFLVVEMLVLWSAERLAN